MTLSAASPTTVDLMNPGTWVMMVNASELPSVTILYPDDSPASAPAITDNGDGTYTIGHVFDRPGRHVAAISIPATSESLVMVAYAVDLALAANLPTFATLDEYLGVGQHSWTDDDLTQAMDVETAAQRRVCRIPAAYPADLHEALLRRAARNLEMRRQLTEQPRTDSDFGVPALVPPGRDQEVRRLEAPFRKVRVG